MFLLKTKIIIKVKLIIHACALLPFLVIPIIAILLLYNTLSMHVYAAEHAAQNILTQEHAPENISTL